MPNQFQSYRTRVNKLKKVIDQTRTNNNTLEILKKNKVRLLDILNNKDIPEKDKQRILDQLKSKRKLK
jgi:hypothetical protein